MSTIYRKTIIFGVLFLIVAMALSAGGTWYFTTRDTLIAEIDGHSITKQDLMDKLEDQYAEIVLQDMIYQILLVQASEKAGITVTDEELTNQINILKASYQIADDAELEYVLSLSGFTMDDFVEDIRLQVLAEKLSTKDVLVTEEEIEKYFEENTDQFRYPESISLAHILLETEEQAEEVLARIKDGEDFDALVLEESVDEHTKFAGGTLGTYSINELPSDLADLFDLEENEIYNSVVFTAMGPSILKVVEIIPEEQLPLSFVRDEIEEYLIKQSSDTLSISELLQKLKEEADIDIRDEEYADIISSI